MRVGERKAWDSNPHDLAACSLANCPGNPYPAAFLRREQSQPPMETKGIEPFTDCLQGSLACPWNMRPRSQRSGRESDPVFRPTTAACGQPHLQTVSDPGWSRTIVSWMSPKPHSLSPPVSVVSAPHPSAPPPGGRE